MNDDFIIIAYGHPERYQRDIDNMQLFTNRINRKLLRYNREWVISTDQYKDNKTIFDHDKLNGWAAWKPLIILDALKYNDRVLYMDANTVFRIEYIDKIESIVNSVDVLTSIYTDFKHNDYTRKECFDIMNCNYIKQQNVNQVWSGVVIATNKSIDILNEWLYWCCVPDAVCSDESDIHHHNHRHDQSILTNLMIKHNLSPIKTNAFMDNQNYRNDPITLKKLL